MKNKIKCWCSVLFPLLLSIGILLWCGVSSTWLEALVVGCLVYWVTVSLPNFRHSLHKITYLQQRTKNIVHVGITLFNNIHRKFSKQLPIEETLQEACKELNLLVEPSIYLTGVDEPYSWDCLFSKCLDELNGLTQEIVIISELSDIDLINACSQIKIILYRIRFVVGVQLNSTSHRQTEVSGAFLIEDLVDLLRQFRVVEKYSK